MKSILNEIQLLTDIVLEEDIALTFFPVKKCAPKQRTVQRALGIPGVMKVTLRIKALDRSRVT